MIDDGIRRCVWAASDSEYARYHDREWGRPLHGDRELFEKLCLEGFQAGLSWIMILRRRSAFREVFHNFDINAVAEMSPSDVENVVKDSRIIRNRAKIESTISNAKIARTLVTRRPGGLDKLIWSFAPPPRPESERPRLQQDIPATTGESESLSAALRALGFRFTGPTTTYALMQAGGLVDDHLRGCWRVRPPTKPPQAP